MPLNRRQLLNASIGVTAAAVASPWVARFSKADDEIRVAELHDLTGPIDLFGIADNEAFAVAVEETNKAGGLLGKPVRVITYDTQSNNQLYAQYAQTAAVQEKVHVVHGGITSASREVIRPILKKFETLYFYNSNYEGGVCDRNTFCVGTVPGHSVKALINHAIKNIGKSMYQIAADYNYGQIISAWGKKLAEQQGGSIVASDFFPLDVTEFGSTISKIQAAKPDMVFSALVGTNQLSFYRQWAAAGMLKEIPIISPVFAAGTDLSLLQPSETEGIIVAYSYFEQIDTPENNAWTEAFRKRFNRPKGYINDNLHDAYLGWKMYAAGVEKAGTTDRMKVIEALESGITVNLPTGSYTMHGPTHHCIKDASIAVVKNGELTITETFKQLMPESEAVCNLSTKPDDDHQYLPEEYPT